jgi:hypothetical protein
VHSNSATGGFVASGAFVASAGGGVSVASSPPPQAVSTMLMTTVNSMSLCNIRVAFTFTPP